MVVAEIPAAEAMLETGWIPQRSQEAPKGFMWCASACCGSPVQETLSRFKVLEKTAWTTPSFDEKVTWMRLLTWLGADCCAFSQSFHEVTGPMTPSPLPYANSARPHTLSGPAQWGRVHGSVSHMDESAQSCCSVPIQELGVSAGETRRKGVKSQTESQELKGGVSGGRILLEEAQFPSSGFPPSGVGSNLKSHSPTSGMPEGWVCASARFLWLRFGLRERGFGGRW